MTKAEFDLTCEVLMASVSDTAAYCMGIVTQMAWTDGLEVDRSLLEDCNQVDLALANSVTLDTLGDFCTTLYSSWKEFRCRKTIC